MPEADPLEQFLESLAAAAGTPRLDRAEVDAVLELARVVAHSTRRRLAPVSTYLAGLAIGATPGAESADRAAQVRAIRDAVRRLTGEVEHG